MDIRANEFKDQVVVITGAAGVFGSWIAQAFAEVGARLCLSDIRQDKLESLKQSLDLADDRVLLHKTDLRSSDSILALVKAVGEKFGAADIVINNAGIYPGGFLLDIDLDTWNAVMDINVRAPFIVSREFARQMIKAGKEGKFINISSGASRSMRTTMVPYCTSKTALERLTKGLALELSPYKIRVNAVEPGFAPGSEVSLLPQEHVEAVSSRNPLGRTSQPQDVPNAIMFLCSSQASYITGTTLSVDGGGSAGSMVVYEAKKEATV
ncbi:MAG: glucose 1-dehydrogenase [Trueperaceae bacterium]|nr:glucose 1-dehydrogenase [Trueperaceae bacterium]